MKCETCKRKCLFFIDCKCEKKLCLKCKDNHKCDFDYKKEGKTQLSKNLVKVESEKINKI